MWREIKRSLSETLKQICISRDLNLLEENEEGDAGGTTATETCCREAEVADWMAVSGWLGDGLAE